MDKGVELEAQSNPLNLCTKPPCRHQTGQNSRPDMQTFVRSGSELDASVFDALADQADIAGRPVLGMFVPWLARSWVAWIPA